MKKVTVVYSIEDEAEFDEEWKEILLKIGTSPNKKWWISSFAHMDAIQALKDVELCLDSGSNYIAIRKIVNNANLH